MLTLMLGGFVVLVIFAVCKALGTSRATYLKATGVPLLLAFAWISLTIRFETHAFCLPGYVLALFACVPPLVLALLLCLFFRERPARDEQEP